MMTKLTKVIDIAELYLGYSVPSGLDGDSFDAGVALVLDRIADAPTVDAVPVVRCRDCAHSVLDEAGYRFCDYTLGGEDVDDLFYCAHGEENT